MAKTCNKQIRKTDLLARFGGEEFCVLFPETDISSAAFIAERIRHAISKLAFSYNNIPFSVTISIGVSELLDSNDTMENIIKRSDDSLYKAKENGRNCVILWEG